MRIRIALAAILMAPPALGGKDFPGCGGFDAPLEQIPYTKQAWDLIADPPTDEGGLLASIGGGGGLVDYAALGEQLRQLLPQTNSDPEAYMTAYRGVAMGIALATADRDLAENLTKFISDDEIDIDDLRYNFDSELVRRPSGSFQSEPFEMAALYMMTMNSANEKLADTALNHLERRPFHAIFPPVYIETTLRVESRENQERLFLIYEKRCLRFRGRMSSENELSNLLTLAQDRADLVNSIDNLMVKIIEEHPDILDGELKAFHAAKAGDLESLLPKSFAALRSRVQ